LKKKKKALSMPLVLKCTNNFKKPKNPKKQNKTKKINHKNQKPGLFMSRA
jgi:hypothetical protein